MATAKSLDRTLKEKKIPSNLVRCSRCAGLMIVEQGLNFMVGTAHPDAWLSRCVQCGEVIDPVILQNRMRLSSEA